jgi:membrane dipeptidase
MVEGMRFFDAHCDTISKVHAGEGDIACDSPSHWLHVTLPELKRAGVRAQVFALWAWEGAYGGGTREIALALADELLGICEAHSGDLRLVRRARDLEDDLEKIPVEGRKVAAIAGLEGADALLGRPDDLRLFFDKGVRLLTLAWGDNPFCGSVFGSGAGLSTAGREVVEACEHMGVVVDVSHVSDAAFKDVCGTAAKPFIASHSNCRSVCPNERNLTDDMIRALGERGGVMGMNLGSSFLSGDFYCHTRSLRDEFFRRVGAGESSFADAQSDSAVAQARLPRPSLGLVVDHVRWAINVGGEDCVGLGGDLDGVKSLPEGLDGVDDYPRIAEVLLEGGLSPRQVEKVCFENFARVFGELLP